MSDEPEKPEAVANPQSDLARTIDTTAKAIATIVAVIYVLGFLVTSIHQHVYGFSNLNMFRPKIASAGLLFFVFAGLPLLLAREHKIKLPVAAANDGALRRFSRSLFFDAVSSTWLGFILAMTLEPRRPQIGTFFHWPVVVAMAVAAALYASESINPYFRRASPFGTAIFAGAILYFAVRDIADQQCTGIVISAWLMLGSVIFSHEMEIREWRMQLGNWTQALSLFLAMLVVFSTGLYPNISSSWGGGAALPVTVSFVKEFAVPPSGGNLKAKLVEETDQGFYFLRENDEKATFVQRSLVRAIYFSDDDKGFLPAILKLYVEGALSRPVPGLAPRIQDGSHTSRQIDGEWEASDGPEED